MAIVNNIPRSYQQWSAINATPNDFNLDSGIYGLTIKATVFGTATLQKLQPDGVTYVPMAAPIGANGYSVLQLPAGQYQLTLAGITALTGQIELIARGGLRG
jgi:hypothetical protein